MARGKRRDVDPASLAGRLRALRTAAGLSQDAAAKAVKAQIPGSEFNQTKLSRIEAGLTLPTGQEARLLLQAYSVSGTDVAAFVAEIESLSTEHVDARVILQAGRAHHFQRRMTEAFQQAKTVRSYQPVMVLGPLQTEAYIRAVFDPDDELTRADASAAVLERIAQTKQALDPTRTLHFIQTEGALRWPVKSRDVQIGQLERLIELSRLEHVRFGLIPLDVVAPEPGPLTGFHIYDDEQVVVGTDTGTAILRDPDRVAPYLEMFRQVEALAVFDDEARAVLGGLGEKYRRHPPPS